uniref:ATPase n=1 Tax=Parastrongyloides trichosuri TaxID=131310 RepID=A0A0N4ZZT2_PARTI
MLYEETPETLKRCFNEKLLSKIPNVEEFYLKLEDWHSIYDSVDHYLRSYLLKNDATKAILPHLKNKVKVLYLEGIPNMTADMAQIISTNCPEITDLYIEPLQSVDVTFVERMEKLQFINIKGIYRINIPRHVKMVIVTSKYDVDSNMIAGMNTRESCEYFKERLNRNFTVSLRNCNETFLKYNVFFDNFLDWKVYLKKLNYFRCPF